MKFISRREFFLISFASISFLGNSASALFAGGLAREIGWEDLTPTGEAVLFPTVSHRGETAVQDLTEANPVTALDGGYFRVPGFIIPLSFDGLDVSEFILAPYKGACIHVPAPPPNQLIHVKTTDPYPSARMARPVWVTGYLRVETSSTTLAEIGYAMTADKIEIYEYE